MEGSDGEGTGRGKDSDKKPAKPPTPKYGKLSKNYVRKKTGGANAGKVRLSAGSGSSDGKPRRKRSD